VRRIWLIALLNVVVLLSGATVSATRSGGSDEFRRLAREIGSCTVPGNADSLRVAGPNQLGDAEDTSPLSGGYGTTTGEITVNGTHKKPVGRTTIANFPHKQSWEIRTFLGTQEESNFGLALDFADPLGERINGLWLSVPQEVSTTAGVGLQHPLLWRGLAAGQRVLGYNKNCRSILVITRSVAAEAWEFQVVSEPGRHWTFGTVTMGLWFSSDLPPYQWVRVWAVGKPFGFSLQAHLEAAYYRGQR
jgi:hypothetical protein